MPTQPLGGSSKFIHIALLNIPFVVGVDHQTLLFL